MTGEDIVIRPFRCEDQEEVIRLWEDCGLIVPQNDPKNDIRRKCAFQPGLFLVGRGEGGIVATVMAGYEGHRGWINYLAVIPQCRHRGVGRRMMQEAEKKLRVMGCPKINLQVRSANTGVIEFYKKIGFGRDDVISLGKKLDDRGE